MTFTARLLTLLAVILGSTACGHIRLAERYRRASPAAPPLAAPLPADGLVPSSHLIVGRVLALDPANGFVVVELAADAPADGIANGADLIARSVDLRETAQLQASRYVRGRTLGAKIISGQPSPGDEVVWLAP